MDKKIVLAFVFLPITLLLIWLAIINISIESMREVKLRVAGYDPRDLFRGHYIEYVIDWEKTDCTQFEEGVCPIEKFEFIRAKEGMTYRFYIPEQYAEKLDMAFRDSGRWDGEGDNSYVFEVVYAYSPSQQPIAKEMLINGRPWQEEINRFFMDR